MNQVAQPINLPLQLLGGISPAEFMRKYWQKKPWHIKFKTVGIFKFGIPEWFTLNFCLP